MWIEVHDSLPDNEKTTDLMERTGLLDTQVIGMLICIWTWAIHHRPDGKLSLNDWRVVERQARWTGEPKVFFSALISSHWIDEIQNGYYLHDWDVYAGKLNLKREKDRQRKSTGNPAEFQRKSSGIPVETARNSNGKPAESDGIPSATVTYTLTTTTEDLNIGGSTSGAPAHEEHADGCDGATPEPMPAPAGDVSQDQACRCFFHYETKFGCSTVFAVEGMKSFLDDGVEDEMICAAIDECVKAKARNWPFLRTILNECFSEGCLTLEAFRQRKSRRVQPRASPDGPGGPPGTESDTIAQARKMLREEDDGP